MSENPHFHRVGFCTERRPEDGAPCTLSWGHSGRHSYCEEEFDVPMSKTDWFIVLCAAAAMFILFIVFSGVAGAAIDIIIERFMR